MPFGLGFAELLVVLLVLGAPVVLILRAAKLISRGLTSGRNSRQQVENQQLAAELRQAQLRIAELEEKIGARRGEG